VADPAALKLKYWRQRLQRRLRVLYHDSVTLSRTVARDVDFVGFCSAQDSTLSRCDGAALVEQPGRLEWSLAGRWESLQRHHTAWRIRPHIAIAISDAIRPGRLSASPPAREDLHTRSSLVGCPCQANMLAQCLFAAYSMLRELTALAGHAGGAVLLSSFACMIHLQASKPSLEDGMVARGF
jgi:hypothetical protein